MNSYYKLSSSICKQEFEDRQEKNNITIAKSKSPAFFSLFKMRICCLFDRGRRFLRNIRVTTYSSNQQKRSNNFVSWVPATAFSSIYIEEKVKYPRLLKQCRERNNSIWIKPITLFLNCRLTSNLYINNE